MLQKHNAQNKARYLEMGLSEETAERETIKDVQRDYEQGFPGLGI